MDILKDVRETRQVASVLSDLLLDIEGVKISSVLTEAMVADVVSGARLVKGQIVLLVTRATDGTIIASIPAVVTNVDRYTNTAPIAVSYGIRTLLGKVDTKDDISAPTIITGDTLAEKIDINVPTSIIDFIKENNMAGSAIEFKALLNVKHLFYMENDLLNSFF